jgi:15-cis-phytoene synthase
MSSSIETFHALSHDFSKNVTKAYSTSFSLAIKLLAPSIRQDIYNIYGFVRMADEIVDTFHEFPKENLLNMFEKELHSAIDNRISLNPALNSFQFTVHKYNIGYDLINAFMSSMRRDLTKESYSVEEYKDYIYGSADVVGLMCLRVFVNGNNTEYDKLKAGAMKLGSGFQKVNFLRDVKDDFEILNRVYFPTVDPNKLSEQDKRNIIAEVKEDFKEAFQSIKKLPNSSQFGVFMAYRYYIKLLKKLEMSAPEEIMKKRIRIPNFRKITLLISTYFRYRLLEDI